MTNKLYAERDAEALEPHYCNHVSAMTSEGLHSKSDIAAELAYRDHQIEKLKKIAEMASVFIDDVMPQASKIVIQDFMNLNELCISLTELKAETE